MSWRESAQFRRESRQRRAQRVRKHVAGNADRPRLSVYRSNRYIFAQVIDDEAGLTIVSAHDLKMEAPQFEGIGGKIARAKAVGLALAEAAKSKGIEKVVFDRSGYQYHGRVAALAEGAREGGLEF